MHEKQHKFQYFWVALLVLLSGLMGACDSGQSGPVVDLNDVVSDKDLSKKKTPRQQNKTLKTLYFGFDLRASPEEDSRQYLPFLQYLEQATGYHFELRFTPQKESIVDHLGSGKVHFAAIGAVSYIQGREKYGITSLVRGLNSNNKANYQSMIVVRPGSNLKSVNQLRGKRFAFGSQDSTQGHLIPRIVLNERGIRLVDLLSYEYTGSHLRCAEAVISNKADACGMQDTMAINMERQGLVNVLHQSRYYPSSGIAVYREVPQDVQEKVKKALLEFAPTGKHKQSLYNWDKTEMPNGFVTSEDKHYKNMRRWLIRMGMLEQAGQTHIAQ